MSEQKTVLFDSHQKLKARLVNFGGWQMPVSYTSVLDEHHWVREHCGIFDVSHMGEIKVSGAQSLAFLQHLTTNDVSRLGVGEGQYTAMLNEKGGVIDDLIVYRLENHHYFLVVNAGNIAKDYAWIETQAKKFGCQVSNESNLYAQIAVQGPSSQGVLTELLDASAQSSLEHLKYMQIVPVMWQGQALWLARTGYTGEHGYEIYLSNQLAAPLWSKLLEQSQEVRPIGLGARDTLRLEACYLLYGNDMDETVSPLEAGISWATKLEKGDFIGREALLRQKQEGLSRRNFAFKMEDAGVPRHGMDLVSEDGKSVGKVTSGSVLPSVGGAGGMALIHAPELSQGDSVYVDVRGKRKLAKLVKKPLYFPRTK